MTTSHDHELAGRKRISTFPQRLIQVLDLGSQLSPGKPEEQDAGVAKVLTKDQFGEIAVSNYKDTLLLPQDGQERVKLRRGVSDCGLEARD